MSTPGSTHATRACGVDLEHAVHLGGDDHDGVVERRRAAREPGAAAARDERPAVPARDAHRGRDLGGRPGEAHGDGVGPRSTPGVARVQRELERLRARTVRTERGAQISEERVVRCDRRSLVVSTVRSARYAAMRTD